MDIIFNMRCPPSTERPCLPNPVLRREIALATIGSLVCEDNMSAIKVWYSNAERVFAGWDSWIASTPTVSTGAVRSVRNSCDNVFNVVTSVEYDFCVQLSVIIPYWSGYV